MSDSEGAYRYSIGGMYTGSGRSLAMLRRFTGLPVPGDDNDVTAASLKCLSIKSLSSMTGEP